MALTADEEVCSNAGEKSAALSQRCHQTEDPTKDQQHQTERQQDHDDPVQVCRETYRPLLQAQCNLLPHVQVYRHLEQLCPFSFSDFELETTRGVQCLLSMIIS